MEDTEASNLARFTADSDQPTSNRNDDELLKNADMIVEDCQQQHQRRQRTGANGRWCTSSVRSRSSTSFLIHNLLISCSGDVPATASPPSPTARDKDNEDLTTSSSSGSESKSRSCSPREMRPSSPPPPVTGVHPADEEEDVDGTACNADDRYRVKRRKCTVPFRRRMAKKKYAIGTNADSDETDDNDKKESKKIVNILQL